MKRARLALPRVTLVRRFDTHRLIPSKYSEDDSSALKAIADDDRHLRDIVDLDNATSDRLHAEHNRLPGIGLDELVFGVPHFRIVNAAFWHAHPLGSRFNGPERGAWYASFDLATAQAEVAFRKSIELAEVGELGWFDEVVTYDDYLADFSARFHDLRKDQRFADYLASESYVASQDLAQRLLHEGSPGVIYPNVRRKSGTCVACFRPALVTNVRKAATYRFSWKGRSKPAINRAK